MQIVPVTIRWSYVSSDCSALVDWRGAPKVTIIVCGHKASVVALVRIIIILFVGSIQESVVPQLVSERLNLGVDSGERHPSEVGEVFTDGQVQGVGSVEDVRVNLQVSSS